MYGLTRAILSPRILPTMYLKITCSRRHLLYTSGMYLLRRSLVCWFIKLSARLKKWLLVICFSGFHVQKISFSFYYFYACMRRSALILLFPFAVFFTETVVFPMEINTRCKKVISKKMTEGISCPHKKGKCENPGGKCNTSSSCSVCPACSIFVFQPPYSPAIEKIIPREYRVRNWTLVSFYSSEIWKPPDNYLLSM